MTVVPLSKVKCLSTVSTKMSVCWYTVGGLGSSSFTFVLFKGGGEVKGERNSRLGIFSSPCWVAKDVFSQPLLRRSVYTTASGYLTKPAGWTVDQLSVSVGTLSPDFVCSGVYLYILWKFCLALPHSVETPAGQPVNLGCA